MDAKQLIDGVEGGMSISLYSPEHDRYLHSKDGGEWIVTEKHEQKQNAEIFTVKTNKAGNKVALISNDGNYVHDKGNGAIDQVPEQPGDDSTWFTPEDVDSKVVHETPQIAFKTYKDQYIKADKYWKVGATNKKVDEWEKWIVMLEEEAESFKIDYGEAITRKALAADLLTSTIIKNEKNGTVTEHVSFEESVEDTHSWTVTHSARVWIVATVSFSPPEKGGWGGSVEVGGEYTYNDETSNTHTVTGTLTKSMSVEVSAQESVRVKFVIKKFELDIPYTMTITYKSGHTATVKGTYKGVRHGETSIEVSEPDT